MNYIDLVGGLDQAEMIVSGAMEVLACHNCYLHVLKAYGYADQHRNMLFLFDEHQHQYLPYERLDDAYDQYVLLSDLQSEIESLYDKKLDFSCV